MALPISTTDMADLLELLTHNGKKGTGYFDELMRSVHTHVQAEYDSGRISPAEYAKAYVEVTNGAMSGAINYLTTAPAALYQAKLVEQQVELANVEVNIKLKELELKEKELAQADAQLEVLVAQKAKLVADAANVEQTTLNLNEQHKALVHETVSAEHKATALEYRSWAEYATTHDNLPDGAPVLGSLGVDKRVKEANIVSFKAKDMYQMVNALQSSNTAQITTLGDVSISPLSTTGDKIDNAVEAYYNLLGVTVN